MTTNVQQLKALGHLPQVSLGDLNSESARSLEPALTHFLNERCCHHPDQADEELAKATDPAKVAAQLDVTEERAGELVLAHKRMLDSAESSRSVPKGCLPEYPDEHAWKIFVDYDAFPDHYMRPLDRGDVQTMLRANVWRWSEEEAFDLMVGVELLKVSMMFWIETYRLIGFRLVEVFDGPNGTEHNIHMKPVRKPGSVIGEAWFNDGTCGDHVDNHLDPTWTAGVVGKTRLGAHEIGHNVNFQHEFRGQSSHKSVMGYDPPDDGLYYGYSTGDTPHVLPRDPALNQAARFWTVEPLDLEDGGEPEVPPSPPAPPTGERLVSEFVDEGRTYRTYRVNPPTEGGGVIWE